MGAGPRDVVLYASSCAATSKARADAARIRRILVAKRVPFEELDLADPVEGRAWRQRMLSARNLPPGPPALPQLHAAGAFVGGGDDVQELEDFGELDAALRGEVTLPHAGA